MSTTEQQQLMLARKDVPEPPKDTPDELKQYLKTLTDQFRTNDYAIQNYINKQPQSARAHGNTIDFAGPPGVPILLTLETTDYDITGNMVDLANDRIILPATGIYLLSGLVHWDFDPAAWAPLSTRVYIYSNGTLSFNRTFNQFVDPNFVASVDQGFSSQYRGSIRDYLQIYAEDVGAGGHAKITEFTVTIVGRTPSVTQ